MNERHEGYPRFSPVGESALLIELSDLLSPQVNQRILALDHYLLQAPLVGVREWVPAYSSLLVHFDPMQTNSSEVELWVRECLNSSGGVNDQKLKRVEIPVRYGGFDGPDLRYVAEYHGLSVKAVVEKHAGNVYHVGMMGFLPGFAYLTGLDQSLATPRLSTPRQVVPGGSIGIAGGQTGIYPLESPGGWQLIGRTEAELFNPDREPHFLLSPGDEVCFIPRTVGDAA